ncbi:MAG: hypothetical protein WBA77_05340 [Microcoleaceae cyanobacterium]
MIISDLNYLEVINETKVVGGISVDKTVDIDVNTDLDTDVNIDINKDLDADLDFDSNVDITGNLATVTFDVTAIGNNTASEADISVVATSGLSEVSGSLFAAVD